MWHTTTYAYSTTTTSVNANGHWYNFLHQCLKLQCWHNDAMFILGRSMMVMVMVLSMMMAQGQHNHQPHTIHCIFVITIYSYSHWWIYSVAVKIFICTQLMMFSQGIMQPRNSGLFYILLQKHTQRCCIFEHDPLIDLEKQLSQERGSSTVTYFQIEKETQWLTNSMVFW